MGECVLAFASLLLHFSILFFPRTTKRSAHTTERWVRSRSRSWGCGNRCFCQILCCSSFQLPSVVPHGQDLHLTPSNNRLSARALTSSPHIHYTKDRRIKLVLASAPIPYSLNVYLDTDRRWTTGIAGHILAPLEQLSLNYSCPDRPGARWTFDMFQVL